MRSGFLLVLALLACALGVAACGGDDDVDVQKVLTETFGEDKEIKSGRLDLSLRLDARGLAQLQGPVGVKLSGPFASTGKDTLPRFAFEANLDAGGQSIKAGATSTGEKGFLSLQGQDYAMSEELYKQFREGYAAEAKKDEGNDEGVSFKALGVDPQRWLRNPEYVGKEEVGGTQTLHVKAGIDVPRLLEDLNRVLARAENVQQDRARQLSEAERRQITEAIEDAKLDLWTGEDDKILRRINVQLKFTVPEESRQQTQGLTGGTLAFDLGLGAINEEQQFREPADARPLEELTGGQAPGGAAPGGGSGGSGGAGAPPASPYEQCVQEAGGDIAKLQECASLQGG